MGSHYSMPPVGTAPFENQFVRINREVLSQQLFRHFWEADEGRSLSVLLVLALSGGGRPNVLSHIRDENLAAFSGVRRKHLQECIRTLTQTKALTSLQSGRTSQTIHYTLNPILLAAPEQRYFTFQGRIVTKGGWPTLENSDRVVLWALARTAYPEFRDIAHFENDEPDCFRWALDISERRDQENPNYPVLPRIGKTSYRRIANYIGMNSATVHRSMSRLTGCAGGQLLQTCKGDGSFWYHLPDTLWDRVRK